MSIVTATIVKESKKLDPEFQVIMIDTSREMNKVPVARIVLIDGNPAIQKFEITDSDFFEPGSEIEIKLRYEEESGKEASVFKGVVLSQVISADKDGFLLNIELKHKAFSLTTTRKNAVFTDKGDYEIAAALLGGCGVTAGGSLGTDYKHKQLVQYSCSDWDFALSRTEANGCAVIANDDKILLKSVKDMEGAGTDITIVLGIDEIFDFELEANASDQLDKVSSTAWNSKDQILMQAKTSTSFDPVFGNLKGAGLAEKIGTKELQLINSGEIEALEVEAWANAKLVKSRMSLFRGRISVRGRADIKPGDTLKIEGMGDRFKGKALVSGIFHRVDMDGWVTTIQLGLSSESLTDYAANVTEKPALGLLPAIHGLQIGVVDKFEKDNNFRVKVKVPAFYSDKDGIVWARLASLYAGGERGAFFFPEKGDEVVLGFFNDDPRQAVILGSLYSSANTIPKNFAFDEKNPDKGIVMKNGAQLRFKDEADSIIELITPGKNSILFDDKKKSVVVSDANGNTIEMTDQGVVIKSAKDLTLEATGKLTIKGAKVDVQ